MKKLKTKTSISITYLGLAILMAIVALFPFLSGFGNNKEITVAPQASVESVNAYQPSETLSGEGTNIFENLSITQSGIVLNDSNFRQENFTFPTKIEDSENPGSYIYKVADDPETTACNILYLVGPYTILPVSAEDAGLGNYIWKNGDEIPKTITLTQQELNYNTLAPKTFDNSSADPDNGSIISTQYFAVSAPLSEPKLFKYVLTIGGTTSYTFYIYQAIDMNYENIGLAWEKGTSGSTTSISTPAENELYTSETGDFFVQLVLSGQVLKNTFGLNNTLYIDFWHNGKSYSLSAEILNNEGEMKFFNNYVSLYNVSNTYASTHNDDISLNFKDLSQKIYYLRLKESGEYKIKIYDKTFVKNDFTLPSYNEKTENSIYSNANYFEHNFTIVNKNNLNGFYCTAVSLDENSNKNYLVGEIGHAENSAPLQETFPLQRINGSVTVSFHNLADIESIKHIKYAITEGTTGNIARNETDIDITTNPNFVSTLIDEEADHYFYITLKEGSSFYGSFPTKVIGFEILKGIRSSYAFGSKIYPTAEITEFNKVVTETLNQSFTAKTENVNMVSYPSLLSGTALYGYNASSFVLNLAKSSPSIAGIQNNGSATSAVNLSFTGVATANIGASIKVYKNGSLMYDAVRYNTTDEAFSSTYKCNDPGSYKVVFVDAMNNRTELNFKIVQTQNTAGIILIVVSVVLVGAAIFFIIKTRSKVSVK
ncbi:MAG: hypothetical protein IJS68_00185 [Clostridia bacterium]|nr:hypothetical protein [Clostridia bacterium]